VSLEERSSVEPSPPAGEFRDLPVAEALNRADQFAREHLRLLVDLARDQIRTWSEVAVRERLIADRRERYYFGKSKRNLSKKQRKAAEPFAPTDTEIDKQCLPLSRLLKSIDESKDIFYRSAGRGTQDEALASMSLEMAAFVLLQSFALHDQGAELAESTGIDAQQLPWEQMQEWFAHFQGDEPAEVYPAPRPEGVIGPEGWKSEGSRSIAEPAWIRILEVAMDLIRAHVRRQPAADIEVPVLVMSAEQRVLLLLLHMGALDRTLTVSQADLEIILGFKRGGLTHTMRGLKESAKVERISGSGAYLSASGYREAESLRRQLRIETKEQLYSLISVSRKEVAMRLLEPHG